MFARVLLIMVLLVSCTGKVYGEIDRAILIDSSQPKHTLGPELKYLEDKTGDISLEDLLTGKYDAWHLDDSLEANFGFSESAYWIKGKLLFGSRERNVTQSNRWLMIEYVLLDYVDIYIISSDHTLTHYALGDQRDADYRPFDAAYPIVPVPLIRGEVTEFYIRVKTSSSNQLGVSLHSLESLTNTLSKERLMAGMFYGVMIIMVLYNLFIFFSIGDRTYLYYVLGFLTFTLLAMSLDGVPWQYDLFKDNKWNNLVIPLLISATWLFLVQFSRLFLNSRNRAPMIDGMLKFIIIAFVWSFALSFILDYSFIVQLDTKLTLIGAIALPIAGMVVWRRGHRPARFYVLAWSAYMLGVLLQVLYVLGFVPHSELVENGARWGGLGNVLLLSFALADRINTQKRETEKARQRAIVSTKEAEAAKAEALLNLRRFKNLFDNAAEGIYRCDTSGAFINVNPAFAQIFGYESPEEMVEWVTDTKHQCYKNPSDYDAIEQLFKKFGRFVNIETECLRKDGSSFWCSSSANLVKNKKGEPMYFEGFLIDISERKEKEAALRDREAAEASAQAKSEFLANMSHEIRTPMNAIIGFTALAQKTNLSMKQRDFINKIESSSKNLLGIINDILDFSKIEAGKLDLEVVEFDLNEVINDVVNMLSHRAAEKSLELVVSIKPGVSPRLMGDPLRLEQIIINLANNAIKFTDEGEVIIRVSDVSELDNKVQLEFAVEDTGIGITDEQLARLFKPFSQADGSTTRKYGGTGLGLTISKQLVELMEGDIWASSENGKGSRFAFNAWFDKPTPREGLPESIYDSKELKGMRVLLIDDKDSGQEALVEILTSFECQVRWIAPDYTLIDNLRERFDKKSFDLVIIDRQLQAMSALEAATGVRSLMPFSDIPIVVTALNSEESSIKAIGEQGFVCMIKPITPSVMLDTIQDIFGYTGPRASRRDTSENDERVLKTIKGARVLLVEDTPFNQEIATEFLHQAEVEVLLATNGQEALDILEEDTFDAIIMDCQMPVMDGFEATRRIRHQLGMMKIPIIAMTANAMKGDKMKCLKVGMNDYISKPVAQAKLYRTLAHWLGPAKKTEEVELITEADDNQDEEIQNEALPSHENESKVDYQQVVAEDETSLADSLQEAVQRAANAEPTAQDETQRMAKDAGEETIIESDPEPPQLSPIEDSPIEECSVEGHVIDMEEALLNMGGSEALLHRMLKKFKDEQSESFDELIETYDRGDKATAHRQAHTLKGIAASISANELRYNMAELEKALETGAIDTRIEQLFCEADSAFKQVIAYIEALEEE